ncbi:MAG: hypothetical protein L6420_03220 [Elusimicrobia bacterium]|nr:hypothetical protein [Elusimicrobiota bacterium]
MKKIISMLSILILSGCAYYQPTAVSTNSIGGKYERPTGIAEGVASKFYFFPCYAACSTGEDSLKAAITDALAGRNADTLANVYVDRRTIYFPHIYFPLFIRTDVIVTGTLVKYNTKEFSPDDKFVDIINSKDLELVWQKLIDSPKKEQESIMRKLSDEMISKLQQYLIAKKSKGILSLEEMYLFRFIVGSPVYNW